MIQAVDCNAFTASTQGRICPEAIARRIASSLRALRTKGVPSSASNSVHGAGGSRKGEYTGWSSISTRTSAAASSTTLSSIAGIPSLVSGKTSGSARRRQS